MTRSRTLQRNRHYWRGFVTGVLVCAGFVYLLTVAVTGAYQFGVLA